MMDESRKRVDRHRGYKCLLNVIDYPSELHLVSNRFLFCFFPSLKNTNMLIVLSFYTTEAKLAGLPRGILVLC